MTRERELDVHFDQHVMVVENCIEPEYCDVLVDHFNRAKQYNLTMTRPAVSTDKSDESYFMNPMD